MLLITMRRNSTNTPSLNLFEGLVSSGRSSRGSIRVACRQKFPRFLCKHYYPTCWRNYSDGIKHSLALPYQEFEDEKRSGETLGKIQKVLTDSEKLINSLINVVFVTMVGFVFVMIYAIKIYWPIAPLYFIAIPIIGGISLVLSRKIKTCSAKNSC